MKLRDLIDNVYVIASYESKESIDRNTQEEYKMIDKVYHVNDIIDIVNTCERNRDKKHLIIMDNILFCRKIDKYIEELIDNGKYFGITCVFIEQCSPPLVSNMQQRINNILLPNHESNACLQKIYEHYFETSHSFTNLKCLLLRLPEYTFLIRCDNKLGLVKANINQNIKKHINTNEVEKSNNQQICTTNMDELVTRINAMIHELVSIRDQIKQIK